MSGFPPGRNVGTQLRALRARATRQRRAADRVEAVGKPQPERRTEATPLQAPGGEAWFAAQGWTPFAFQREVWAHIAQGTSGLLHATTGAGKTYAVAFGLFNLALPQAGLKLNAGLNDGPDAEPDAGPDAGPDVAPSVAPNVGPHLGPPAAQPAATLPVITGGGLRLLWITPMRALSADTGLALAAPLSALGLPWKVGVRTGDTTSGERARQIRRLPEILVTTPESLTLWLTRADARETLGEVALVVVDEWHELVASKRGVQVQLALARLRAFRGAQPLPVWGLSATLGNLAEAMAALLYPVHGALVRGRIDKTLVIDTLIPPTPGRFAWAGHLGLQMLAPVVEQIETAATTLVFTNTRSQAELWYQALLKARPDWAGDIALHHGSLDRQAREWVEQGLKLGRLKAVVATSSLDLGVDFAPVERVLQIGSPKGVARLLQRAGRSGHAPGRASRITMVPTHALELIEAAAARTAVLAGRIEPRHAPMRPLDVLVQHLVTVALGEGFDAPALRDEVRATYSYQGLTDAEWDWAMAFVVRGGASLQAYPEFQRVTRADDGRWRVPDAQVARRHRMSVGTIVSDAMVAVRFMNGRNLGTIEEGFVARLRAGDCFVFGGRRLSLVRLRDLVAWVAPARGNSGAVPRWNGSKMPFSNELGDALLQTLEAVAAGHIDSPEVQSVQPLLQVQRSWSALPSRQRLLVEAVRTREGQHLFVYPFAGRLTHIGLASLVALRVGRIRPATFSIAVNDYGFELLSAQPLDWATLWRQAHDPDDGLLREAGLLSDVLASLNASELGSRRFREIARVAGLVFQGFPGAPRSVRQLQASSGLFYDVFRQHDAGNLLLAQADREVLEQELDIERLRSTLTRLRAQVVDFQAVERPTPLAFPLLVERLREQLSTEKLTDRIGRMVAELEQAAGGSPT